jgi:NADH dehydrogenase [ubiquinone] 1 alpha subcomplex assembly factor 7
MELALQHPEHGYYRVRKPIGREGDFITAPEISQMFGEMIGVWCAEAWRSLGKPDPFALIELGPGKGTMMRDVLRATSNVGGFHDAKKLYLIDSDKALRETQRENLHGCDPLYVQDIAHVAPMPALILANEFFDALPVRQFEMTFQGWAERMVTVANDALAVTLRPLQESEWPLIPAAIREAKPGAVAEISPEAQAIMRDLARHLATQKGAILVVDYGYVAMPGNATLQAVANHKHADLFDRPGEVDLTAHVDFTILAEAARVAGLRVSNVIGQGEFLKNLGIEIRADMLKKRGTLPQAAAIDTALARLTDADQMGALFKVMEIRG